MIEMEQTGERILVVDDEPDISWVLEHVLKEKGIVPKKALSGQEALELVKRDCFQMAIVDAKLPDMEGLELAKRIREVQPAVRLIMISGYYSKDEAYIQSALADGLIGGFIVKPFLNDEILKAVEVAISGEPPSQKIK